MSSPSDFSHGSELIDRAGTDRGLARGRNGDRETVTLTARAQTEDWRAERMATERQSQLTVGALPLTIRGHSPSRSERVGEKLKPWFVCK